MSSYKWGYKSPNMGYPTYNPTYNTTRELQVAHKTEGAVGFRDLRVGGLDT